MVAILEHLEKRGHPHIFLLLVHPLQVGSQQKVNYHAGNVDPLQYQEPMTNDATSLV